MIRKAIPSELDIVSSLTQACAVALQHKGIFQWNEKYPSRERLEIDIQREELYVLENSGNINGTIVLTPEGDEVYRDIDWLTDGDHSLYVHRLATHPEVWGKGFGQELMDFCESFARIEAYQSVRLDTFSRNERNVRFYERMGYIRLGDIFFPDQSEYPFHCYEKIL